MRRSPSADHRFRTQSTNTKKEARAECFYSQRGERSEGSVITQNEQLAARSVAGTSGERRRLSASYQKAEYLDYFKKAGSAREAANRAHDASVGSADSHQWRWQGRAGPGHLGERTVGA